MPTLALLVLVLGFQNDGVVDVEIDQIHRDLAGKRVAIEGIFTALGSTNETGQRTMQLQRCPAIFIVPKKILIKDAPQGNLRVSGLLEYQNNKPVVYVESLELLPSETEQFNSFLQKAKEPEQFFSIAEWAERRYKLYNRKELLEFSTQAYTSGIDLIRSKAENDPTKLSALKNRVRKEARLADFDYEELDHAILRAEYAKLPADQLAKLQEFAGVLTGRLVGADSPGKPLDRRFRSLYEKDPLATYKNATPDFRKGLGRYFYALVVARSLDGEANLGLRPPFDLATDAKRKIPDYPEFAKRWFKEWAKAQELRLVSLEPDLVNDLARILVDELQDFPAADRVRHDWLDGKEKELRAAEQDSAARAEAEKRVANRDANAWYELAMQRLNWFPNESASVDRAGKLLLEAIAIAPNLNKAEVQLIKLDFVRDLTGNWRHKSMIAKPIAESKRRPLALDMTAGEVLLQLGEPSRRTRVTTANGVTQQWIYQGTAEPIVIILTGGSSTARVTKLYPASSGANSN